MNVKLVNPKTQQNYTSCEEKEEVEAAEDECKKLVNPKTQKNYTSCEEKEAADAVAAEEEVKANVEKYEDKEICNQFINKWYDDKNSKCKSRITECEIGKYLEKNLNMGVDNSCKENTASNTCSENEILYKSIYKNKAECIDISNDLKNLSKYNIIDNKSEQDIIDAYKKYIETMPESRWGLLYITYRNKYLQLPQMREILDIKEVQEVENVVQWFSDIFSPIKVKKKAEEEQQQRKRLKKRQQQRKRLKKKQQQRKRLKKKQHHRVHGTI